MAEKELITAPDEGFAFPRGALRSRGAILWGQSAGQLGGTVGDYPDTRSAGAYLFFIEYPELCVGVPTLLGSRSREKPTP